MTRYADRFRRISRSFSRFDLTRQSMDEGFPRSAEELLRENCEERRFLDFYGDEGILLALERFGLLRALRRRGFLEFQLSTHARDERHSLFIDASHLSTPVRRPERIVDLVVRVDTLHPRDGEEMGDGVRILTIDWLTLQNPFASFSERRPRAPGQAAPGLGIGEQVLELLYRVAERLQLGAVLTVAEYFHNAVLYARELPFYDPVHAGRLRSLVRGLLGEEGLTLTQASWAIHWGYVREQQEVLKWKGEAQLRAFEPALRAWVSSEAWNEAAQEAEDSLSPTFDREAFEERWRDELPKLLQPPVEVSWAH